VSRVDALRKLLRLGDLHWCEIMDIMGGDRVETEDALARLTQAKEVIRVGGQLAVRFRLVGA